MSKQDVVFQLWQTYLHKTGVAFPEDKTKQHPLQWMFGSDR